MPASTCWTATGARSSPGPAIRTRSCGRIRGTNTPGGIWGSPTVRATTPRPGTPFVYGDFRRVHRMGIIACHYRAAEWRRKDIELAAHDLLQYLDTRAS